VKDVKFCLRSFVLIGRVLGFQCHLLIFMTIFRHVKIAIKEESKLLEKILCHCIKILVVLIF